MLNAKGTLVFLQRGPEAINRRLHLERYHAGGGLLLVTREAWQTVGGYDESFIGWGYEDSDFNLRLLRHAGWDRVPGNAWHLYHGREDNKPRPESKARHRQMLREYSHDISRWGADKGLGARARAVL